MNYTNAKITDLSQLKLPRRSDLIYSSLRQLTLEIICVEGKVIAIDVKVNVGTIPSIKWLKQKLIKLKPIPGQSRKSILLRSNFLSSHQAIQFPSAIGTKIKMDHIPFVLFPQKQFKSKPPVYYRLSSSSWSSSSYFPLIVSDEIKFPIDPTSISAPFPPDEFISRHSWPIDGMVIINTLLYTIIYLSFYGACIAQEIEYLPLTNGNDVAEWIES